jgi:hypothetical protein
MHALKKEKEKILYFLILCDCPCQSSPTCVHASFYNVHVFYSGQASFPPASFPSPPLYRHETRGGRGHDIGQGDFDLKSAE